MADSFRHRDNRRSTVEDAGDAGLVEEHALDRAYGCGLERHSEWDGIVAWRELPKVLLVWIFADDGTGRRRLDGLLKSGWHRR